MPKRSHKVLPLSERIKVFDQEKTKIYIYAEIAKIQGLNEVSICETVKKEKGLHASFVLAPQTAKVTATVYSGCLVEWKGIKFVGGRREQDTPCTTEH